jgi:hypothetical protein
MSDHVNWHDYKSVEKLHKSRAGKGKGIAGRMVKARESGDEIALKKAYEDILKHRKQDEVYKEKAKQSCYYW